MSSYIGSDEGMYARDMWSEGQIVEGSQRLLSALWKQHPRVMRFAFQQGRAKTVGEARDAWDRKQAGAKFKLDYVPAEPRRCGPPPVVKEYVPVVVERSHDDGARLLRSVADAFDITCGELIGEGRSRKFVEARAVVVVVLRERGWSYPRIGKLIGGRDHSTVIWAHQCFDIHAKRNPMVLDMYNRFRPERFA